MTGAFGQLLGEPVNRIRLFHANAHMSGQFCRRIQTGQSSSLVWPSVGFEPQEGGLICQVNRVQVASGA